MKLLFTVQGEGRGHMTQALAVQQWARRQGHQVVGVLSGANHTRSLPDFFEHGFDVPVARMASPGFSFRQGRGVALGATFWNIARSAREFRRSLREIDAAVERTQPDVILNFLEPLVGLGALLRRSRVPVLAIGHQFLLQHPHAPRVNHRRLEQWGLRRYVDLVGAGAVRYALSFYEEPDLPSRGLFVAPPLLRSEIHRLPEAAGNFLLVYLLNHAYRTDLEHWHERNPAVPVHCFYDRPGAPETETARPNLTFHRLHGEKFLHLMARCRAVACTAGFESVSEAACLGKPVLAVPVQGHIEQYVNAADAEAHGLAIHGRSFDLDRLLEAQAGPAQRRFQLWLGESDRRLQRALEFTAVRAGLSARRPPAAPAVPVAASA